MSTMSRSAVLLSALLSCAAPAMAADATPEQATALETQLRDWMASLVAPALDVGPRPVRVTPVGDHLHIELPAPDMLSAIGLVDAGLAINLDVKPMNGGRWAVEDLRLPSPLRVKMPDVAQASKLSKLATPKPGAAADQSVPQPGELVQEMVFDQQNNNGVIDPSFKTTTSLDFSATGYHVTSPGQTVNMAANASHLVMQPVGGGRVNVISEGTGSKMSAQLTVPDMPPISYTIDSMRSVGHVTNLSPDSLATLIRTTAKLVPSVVSTGTSDAPTPEQLDMLRRLLASFASLTSGFDTNLSASGIRVDAMGQAATLRQASFGQDFSTADNKYSLGFSLALEGLDSPAIPKGVFRDYLPRKLVIKPRISGYSVSELQRLIAAAIDSAPNLDIGAIQAGLLATLADNPMEASIDELTFDLGPAKLSANGTFTVPGQSLAEMSGEAEITISGLNALIKRANSNAELKQIAPVLIFLKGIAKADGDDYVWAINYEKGSVTVNDTDLSELMAGFK